MFILSTPEKKLSRLLVYSVADPDDFAIDFINICQVVAVYIALLE